MYQDPVCPSPKHHQSDSLHSSSERVVLAISIYFQLILQNNLLIAFLELLKRSGHWLVSGWVSFHLTSSLSPPAFTSAASVWAGDGSVSI